MCGIVLDINSHKYFAPLNSPKAIHKKYSENPTIMYLGENKEFGIIRFNNMIPVLSSDVKLINVDDVDWKYRLMLNSQHRYIQRYSEKVKKKASLLYKLVVYKKDTFLKEICLDFKLLEEKCKDYKREKSFEIA